MPFRERFDCLWCGTPATARAETDLEGWAQLCPGCLGRAGENPFLRRRLREAIEERGRTRAPAPPPTGTPASTSTRAPASVPDVDADMRAYYAARAAEYDDWYLRRGRYSHGPVHDVAWQTELDAAGRWLDAIPVTGTIVELAAGTGWWSPLLAAKGELWAFDANQEPLELARDRLLAHGLRAHLHVRDAWAEPDRTADALFVGFWLSHVPRERIADFLALARRWLRPGGTFAAIDSLPDAASGAGDHAPPSGDLATRRLADGREFTIVKVHHTPAELAAALRAVGFGDVTVATTGRFFLLARGTA